MRFGVRKKKREFHGGVSILIYPLRLERRSGEEEREGERRTGKGGGTAGKGDERTMGWRGRAFWNGKLFLVGRRRPSWAKKEQAIYISKQAISQGHISYILLWKIPSFFILRPNSWCKLFY